ncbi:hypothetical protein C5F64_12545 [Photobacterium damselae subsp. damselae]|uniref:DUF4165 domain-containing protein n=2 Tax=Photobacterium damselae TaxID=38293 RepID=A0AAD3ZXA5_PHODD|nr:Ig-like domain-containing protein [Photobacterium damselae]KAB1185685.1 DUF4165 domain-containing protein [Photobacterium damselae subsp. damselae]MBE8127633.1 DUF4165 domain-containing protein [Photobacterium damselae subsp. piscicida]PSB85321.1 hypothetical protein C5F64_12545 [Photobacterium damselae subsp. damselae]
MKTPKMTVLAAFLLSSMAVNAEIISISYTDQQGEHQDAPLTQKFFSPKGNTVISFSSGLDRRMRMTVKNPGGLVIANETSHIINTHDRLKINGREFYGVQFSVKDLQSGTYTILSETLDLSGKVVSSKIDTITIDITPPTTGALEAKSYGGVARTGVPSDTWYTGTYSANRYNVLDVTDAESGVKEVFAITKRGDGSVYKRNKVLFDEQAKTANINNGSGWFPSNNATEIFTLQFEVHDKAGNVGYSPIQKMYYDNQNGSIELVGVYNPNSSSSIGGVKGFEPYKSGMLVYTNPVKTMYKVDYNNFHTHSIGGLIPYGQSQVIDNDNGQPVYIIYERPLNFNDGNYVRMSDQRQWQAFGINFYNLKLAPNVNRQPVRVRNRYKYSDIGWSSWGRHVNANDLPIQVEAADITVEARPYDQKFYHMGECTIPAGKTSCTITYSPPKEMSLGSHGNYHSGSEIKSADGKLYGAPGWASVHWNNDEIPSITKTEWDPSLKRVTVYAYQPERGYYFDSIRITDAYLNNHNKRINVPRIVWEENGTNYKFVYDLSKLPDGDYDIDAVVMEAHRNFDTKNVVKFKNDAIAPAITIDYNGQPVEGMVHGIKGLTLTVDDASETSILDITLKGGPTSDYIYLAYRSNGDNKYKIEQPKIFPALVDSEQYTLTVRAKDSFGNIGTQTAKFTYTPDNWIKLKAVTTLPVSHQLLLKNDKPAAMITSSELRTDSGSIATGPQEGIVTVRSDADYGVMIEGTHIEPGKTEKVMFNMQGATGKLEVPIYPDKNVKEGKAEFMLDIQQLRSIHDK